MAKKAPKTDGEIGTIVAAVISEMEIYDDRDLNDDREKALRYYEGEMQEIAPDDPDGSKVVSFDVRDAVDWIMPQLMRIFFGGQKTFGYAARSRAYSKECREASEYINNDLLEELDIYETMYDVFHDALLQQNGIVKIFRCHEKQWQGETLEDVSELQLAELSESDEIEILSQDSHTIEETDEFGDLVTVDMFDVRLRRKIADGITRLEGLPREEFLIAINARSIDEAKGVSHKRRVTRGELLKEGFKKKDIEKLTPFSYLMKEEENIRDNYQDPDDTNADDWATQEVVLYETYLKLDHDNDGIADEVKVLSGGEGTTILEWELWDDDRPFVDLAPERRAHRWAGRSVADHVMDIQEIKTVLLRQTMDNIYDNNDPTQTVQKHLIHNLDAVFNRERGGKILTKGPGAIENIAPTFTAKESYDMLAYMDEMMTKRIGASGETMALQPDALARQTDMANAAVLSSAYTKVEYIARNMAMGGMKKIGRIIYNLTRKYQDDTEYELKGEWRGVRPNMWPERITCTVIPGLGTGSRERDLSILQMTLGLQREALSMAGPEAPIAAKLVFAIRETLVKIVEATNLPNADEFFPELTDEDLQAMQQAAKGKGGDPLVMAESVKAQATMGTAKIKSETDLKKEGMETKVASMKLQQEELHWKAEMMLREREVRVKEDTLKLEARKIGMEAGNKSRDLDLKVAATEGVYAGKDGAPTNAVSEVAMLLAKVSDQIDQIEARKAAPKRVIRDENNQIIGTELLQ